MDKNKDEYVRGVRDVARKVRVALMFLRDGKPFPTDMVYDAARELLDRLKRDRNRSLFSLGTLREERQWLRQNVEVATALGDCMLSETRWQSDAQDAVVGALLHTMGKPLLLDMEYYSRDIGLTREQRALLRNHAPALVDALRQGGWEPEPVALDIILNINERLDGSGYPAGKTAEQLSDLARMAAVIRVGCKLINPVKRRHHQTPAEVYRRLYLRPNAYDRRWVVWLTRRYSFYPIGSLVHFSSGALGWVMQLDERGWPSMIYLVRDPSRPDVDVNVVLDAGQFERLGKPEDVVNPEDFGLSFPKD